ncbi:MAG: DUF2804 domain-containing protein [Parvibaculum sp.]
MAVIDDNGRVVRGFFDQPVGLIDHTKVRLKSPLGKLLPVEAREAAFRHFQFMGAVSSRYALGCALSYSPLIKGAFLYLYDMEGREFLLETRLSVRKDGDVYDLARDPDEGCSLFVAGGSQIEMKASKLAGTKSLIARLADGVTIDLSFADSAPAFSPMRLCTQTGATGWTYAQKVAGVPAMGSISGPFGMFDFAKIGACAHHDYTSGFLRPETYWNWACFSARDDAGRLLGLNVSNGVNESGFSENCFWVDGRLVKTDLVLIEFDDEDLDRPWRIRSGGGAVDLTFTPVGGYHAVGDGGIVASNFHQMFGHFDGVLQDPELGPLAVKRLGGFSETQYLRW